MTRSSTTRLLREAAHLSLGIISLAAVTGLYFWLDLPLASAAFTYLIVIVLLSLVNTFASSIALSFIAQGCLQYFFAPPIWSFRVDSREDAIAIGAFLITSFIVTGLVRRVRAEQAERTLASARLREVQVQLAHLDRLVTIGQLVATLVHEIMQPIASARNNAGAALNFLEKQPLDLGEVREALGCVAGDADRARDIIDRIRDQIKKAPPRMDRCNLNEAIEEVILLAGSAITKNGVSVRTRLAEGLFPIQGDRVQLQQVVLNLILNAVEAMNSVEAGARELLISTEQNQTNGVLVAVSDSGPGLVLANLERVFDPFYTTKPSGLGMGLSICRSIIEAHGGRLWASANVPRGAVFQFTVPPTRVAHRNWSAGTVTC